MVKRVISHKVTHAVSLAIGLLLTAFILMIVIFKTDFFADSAGGMFSRYLFGGTDFTLEIGEMSGNPLRHIVVRNFTIRYQGDDFSYDVVRIDRIELEYSVRSIASGTPSFSLVELDSPHVWIKPDSSGINIIPRMEGGGGGGALPVFEVERFVLRDGQVIFQKPERADALRNIELMGSVDSDGSIARVELSGGSAEDIRREIFMRDVTGTVEYVHREDEERVPGGKPGEIFLDSLYVELDESALNATGSIDPDSMIFDVMMHAFPLDVEEVTRLANVETWHFGELQGPIHIMGTPTNLHVDAVLNGIFSGYALDGFELEGAWAPPMFRIDRGEGRFNGASVRGNGYYTLDSPERLELDLRARELDLSQGFSRGSNLPATDINGMVHLAYYTETKELRFNCDLAAGHIREVPFEKALIAGSYSPEDLAFERIEADSPTHSIRGHGSLDGDDLRMYFDISAAREDTLFPYLGIEAYRGNVKLTGVVSGTYDEWELRGNGEFTDFDYSRANVPSGEIMLVVTKEESYAVQVELTGDSCHIDPVGFSWIGVSLEYYDDVTTFKRLYLTRPGLDADMSGEVRTSDGRTEIEFTDVVVNTLDEQWRSNGNFTVLMDDEGIEFDDLQLHSRAGALYLDLRVDEAEDVITGVFSFNRADASLLNAAGVTDERLAGRGAGSLTLSGCLSDPAVDMEATISDGSYDTLQIDTMRLTANYADGTYSIDELSLSSPLGDLGITGELRGCSMRKLMKEGRVALKTHTVDIAASCSDLSLAPFLKMSKKIPFRSGYFTGRVEVSDSLVHPLATMNGSIRDLSRKNLRFPLVEIEAGLEANRVMLHGKVSLGEGHDGEFAGRIPIDREEWFYSINTDREVYLELYKPSGPMKDLPGVTDLLAEAEGRFSAGLRLEGSISEPVILGDLKLEKGGFRPAGMEERFRDVDAAIILQDTLITIKSLSGKEGKEGSFKGSGRIVLSGWRPVLYDVDLHVDKFLVASIPDVIAITSGDVHAGTETVGGRAVPSITGDLEVNRAEVFLVFDEFTSSRPTATLEPSLLAAIDLDIPGNAWIKTPDSSIEMQGEVTLHHDQRGTYLRGELDLVRGWYNVYSNKFKVRSGKLEFVHAGGFRPVVDIEAETLDPEGRKIFLSLLWEQDDPEPKLTLVHEDPGYSETDIWKMLGGGVVDQPGGQESWDAMGTAQSLAANYIERVLNSQMEGITIELETEQAQDGASNGSDQKQTMVAVGKYLSEGLYVKYKQGLAIQTARTVEVEYRISRLFLLRTQLIKYSSAGIQGESSRSTDEYNVDLKLRWEF